MDNDGWFILGALLGWFSCSFLILGILKWEKRKLRREYDLLVKKREEQDDAQTND